MSDLKVFRVDDGGEVVWVISDDPEKARVISREYLRDSEHPEDYDEDEAVAAMDPSEILGILDEDTGKQVSKTVAEWVESESEGFLATTCF